MLFDVVPAVAIVIGGAVAMSSTAIIIAQLTEQSENNRTHGRLAVAICLFQDLSFPLLLALVSALSGGGRAADAVHILSSHRHRRAGTAAGAGGRPLAAAAGVPHDRFGALRGAVLAGGAAGGACLGLGNPGGGPVARARRFSGRDDARGNRVPPSDRSDDSFVSRSSAGIVFHHGRHAARCGIAAAAIAAGDRHRGRHADAEGRGGGGRREARDQELVQVTAHRRSGVAGR